MLTSRSPDTPFVGSPDTLQVKVVEHPFSFRGSQNKQLNGLIVEAVNRMGGVGEDAEENYRRAVSALKRHADEALDIIAAEYETLPEDRYLDRWSIQRL